MSFFISFLLFPFLCSLHGFTVDDDDDDHDERETNDEFAGANVSEVGSDEWWDEEAGCQRGRLTGMG